MKAVIFDLDGTIVDSIDIYYEMVRLTFEKGGFDAPDGSIILKLMSEGKSFFDVVLPVKIEDRDKIISELRKIGKEIWEEISDVDIKLLPGVSKTIKNLKGKGYKIGIVTSGGGEGIKALRENGLKDCIDVVITRNDVQRLKPAPDSILDCIKMLELLPEDCIYVGDSVVDIIAGKSAGTKTVGVLTGVSNYESLKRENPDIIIRDINELMEYISQDQIA